VGFAFVSHGRLWREAAGQDFGRLPVGLKLGGNRVGQDQGGHVGGLLWLMKSTECACIMD
jgi:hypothetical protein